MNKLARNLIGELYYPLPKTCVFLKAALMDDASNLRLIGPLNRHDRSR